MDIPKFIEDIKFNLIRSHYWYASVLMQLPVIYDDPAVSTMAVGKTHADELQIKLFVNSKYIQNIAEVCQNNRTAILEHFTEVLKHEVHHLIFGHLVLDLPDKQALMIACELSANSYVDRGKLISLNPNEVAGIFPEDYHFQTLWVVGNDDANIDDCPVKGTIMQLNSEGNSFDVIRRFDA